MTKWERLLYNETQEAVNSATEKTAYDTAEHIAINFLIDGLSSEMVSRNTGLDIAVVEELSEKIAKERSKEPVLA